MTAMTASGDGTDRVQAAEEAVRQACRAQAQSAAEMARAVADAQAALAAVRAEVDGDDGEQR